MGALPQLIEEDMQQLDVYLNDLIENSESTAALILDEAGFLVCKNGNLDQLKDPMTLAALASGSHAANTQIADLIGESTFTCTYQEGKNLSLLVCDVESHCLLAILFGQKTNVGTVKHFATHTISQIAQQMRVAQNRAPGETIDLADLNIADTEDLFKQKDS